MTARAPSAVGGRHRGGGSLVFPSPPDDAEKGIYVERYLPYLATIIILGNGSVLASQSAMELAFHVWVMVPYTVFGIVYATISIIANFTGRSFDYAAHEARVKAWRPVTYPDVDLYLPVCGEPVDLVHNTWVHVFELVQAYPGWCTAYVLDDGDDPMLRSLAASFGFAYLVRPNRPWMKKSGNMRHAFACTRGEFFVVLDADFTPRPDLLHEVLPYFDDDRVAIVQTPQFFRTSQRQTWVERAAGAVQEVFYRSMQVSRDDLDASICVGTCAVYRRRALEAEGGTTLIEYAEDVHTGLDARRNGWRLRYIPICLATGQCPSEIDAFVRQQYRWCTGSTSTLLTARLWSVPMSFRARLTYVSGFCFYVYTALLTFVGPAVPIGLLLFLAQHIQPHDYLLVAPALINGMVLYPAWHRSGFGPSTWPLAIIRGWAHALALFDWPRKRIMAWQSTGGGVSHIRRLWVGLYVWNGGTAVAWIVLAAWRIAQDGPGRFWIIAVFGALYAAIVLRILITPRKAVT